jgi:hypothetical protein
VTIRPLDLPPDLLLRILLGATFVLVALVSGLILFGALLQSRRDRQNRHRIACFKDWEVRLAAYLFGGAHERAGFGPIPRADRWLFRGFLSRYQATLAGQEAETLRDLYLDLGVHASLPRRLRSRQARQRAQAAREIGAFLLTREYDLVQPLLRDPAPFVAHVAAQTLTSSQDLRFAGPVLDWVLRQDRYQRERLLRVLEGFGPDLLPWLEANLEAPETAPEPWIIFALLAGSQRHRESQPRLLDLLAIPSLDLQASTLKALAALADPTVYTRVLPLAAHDAWEIRAQAARALGVLGGPEAIPDLIRLTGDPVYEVRRNAAQGLADLGHAGISALGWLADDPAADPFSRDMARERLEWADERGHQ